MDIMMPEMDGVEACRRLKANDDLATIPVIRVSGRDDDRDIIDGLDAGAVDYVTKPFRWPIVSARIRSALRTKEARDVVIQKNAELDEFAHGASHDLQKPMRKIVAFDRTR